MTTKVPSRGDATTPRRQTTADGSVPQGEGPVLNDYDVYLFRQGVHTRMYDTLGAHATDRGVQFRVWAPNAENVSLIGEFNGWKPGAQAMQPRWDSSGIWEAFIPGITAGALYKYHVVSRSGETLEKADPFAFSCEEAPRTASRVTDLDYRWSDQEWMEGRERRNSLAAPHATYEVHLGSWRRDPANPERLLSYRELAPALADYVCDMGYTHVELMPITEHPFYGSWGYQTTGYFAPTSRYGSPQDFMHLVDHLHQRGIGVILDWVPSHFPVDAHGLAKFDGTHLYEHSDPRQGFHPEWSSCIFNYDRHEVRSFLLSSALFWLDRYHLDGLRVDAVASMLYLDYARREGEWIANEHGGKENLGAITFLRTLNEAVYRDFPGTQTIAEESTSWPAVSRPVYTGGLGFGMKWNMGWMHDTLAYFARDPLFRSYHHQQITFSAWYAFSENFVLPLSHDEVVHGKGSLIGKMPGDDWQQFANLRCLLGYMWCHPGKKLLFMGIDFGQRREWQHDASLEWHVLAHPLHRGVNRWVRDLNHALREQPALYELDFDCAGFEWVDNNDAQNSVVAFMRYSQHRTRTVLVLCNFTPLPQEGYRVGVTEPGYWREVLNSDAAAYGGSGIGNLGGVSSRSEPSHGRLHSLCLTLPPLGMLVLERAG